jgi:hypothetical protein
MSSARRVGALAALAVSLAAPAAARANGDPASDYLLARSVFLPFTNDIDKAAAGRLNETTQKAKEAGYEIRTAVIRAPTDLGTASSLFRKPQRYAEFLGLELSFVYPGRLLVVMPNGFGYARKGRPDPKVGRILERVAPPGADATDEVLAATVAIRRLAAAAGHRVAPSEGGSETRDRLTIAAAATVGIAIIAALLLYRRQRASRT